MFIVVYFKMMVTSFEYILISPLFLLIPSTFMFLSLFYTFFVCVYVHPFTAAIKQVKTIAHSSGLTVVSPYIHKISLWSDPSYRKYYPHTKNVLGFFIFFLIDALSMVFYSTLHFFHQFILPSSLCSSHNFIFTVT